MRQLLAQWDLLVLGSGVLLVSQLIVSSRLYHILSFLPPSLVLGEVLLQPWTPFCCCEQECGASSVFSFLSGDESSALSSSLSAVCVLCEL